MTDVGGARRSSAPQNNPATVRASAGAMAALCLASDAPMAMAIKALPGSPLLGVLSALCFAATLAIAMAGLMRGHGGARVLVSWPGLLLLLLCLWAAASLLWSINPSETRTATLFLVANALAAAYVARDGPERALETVFATGVTLLVLSLAVSIALPSLGTMQEEYAGAWRGLWLEKNALGGVAAIAGVVAVTRLFLGRPALGCLLGLGLAVGVIVQAQSMASLLALMVGIVAVAGCFGLRRGPLTAIALSLVGASFLSLLVFLGPALWTEILSVAGRDATLTSRTMIWAALEAHTQDQIVTGYGYAAYFSTPQGPLGFVIQILDFRPFTAHNSLLQARIDFGYPGMALALALVASGLFYGLSQALTRPAAIGLFGVTVTTSAIGVVESVFAAPGGLVWTGVTALLFSAARGDLRPPR